MSNYLQDAFAPSDARYRAELLKSTWGHLAPHRNAIYRGSIVFAVGCYGDDPLNPTVLSVGLRSRTCGELADSPWLFDALQEFIGSDAHRGEAGNVYRFDGMFHNYEFIGAITCVLKG